MLSATGVGKITNKQATKSHHARHYAYAVYNRQALSLLEQILPYLRSYKRDRAALILKDYLVLTPRNGKYSGETLARKKAFEKTVLAIKANG